MHDPINRYRFTDQLEHFCGRIEQLRAEVRLFEPHLIPIELLDEIATTVGELTLVLVDHLAIHHSKELADRLISNARRLRKDLRSGELPNDQIANAVGALSEEVSRMIREDKRAA